MNRYLLTIPALLLAGCGGHAEQYVLPDQVTDFASLFGTNCAGCHGTDGRQGAARPLNDPLFLAVIGKQKLRETIANGVPGKAMPAFAQTAGGALTDHQIAILADQMEARWSRTADFAGLNLPPYGAETGDPVSGAEVYRKQCTRCHGEDGAGKSKSGSVTDPAFLALVSNQSLRTTVIAGRSDRGMPDFRKHSPAMSPGEISDVVAWISSRRTPVMLTQRGTKLP